MTSKLSDDLDFAQGAALILNYHTAWFCLVWRGPAARGRDRARAGGRGRRRDRVPAGRQGRRRATIAVVSTDEKERVARDAGADEVVRATASRTRSRS
jgi:NADPH2:quinone reductase